MSPSTLGPQPGYCASISFAILSKPECSVMSMPLAGSTNLYASGTLSQSMSTPHSSKNVPTLSLSSLEPMLIISWSVASISMPLRT